MMMINKDVPEKVRKVSSDDQDWYTDGLKQLDKKRRREYHHNRRSARYLMLSKQYQAKCKLEKHKFFKNIVRQAKESDPNGWYRLLKRITNHDSVYKDSLVVEEISHLTDKDQVEALASAFNAPSQRYQPLQATDIQIPKFSPDTIPVYTPVQIKQHIDKIKTNKATIPGDIPAKILKRYSKYFCITLADIINTSILTGVWPDRYKKEIIKPIA